MKKKNKTMRAAGALFVATMLTTSMTAGTFAKYTTNDSARDSARVAKFGVVIAANGSLYGQEYKKGVEGNTIIKYSGTDNSGTVQIVDSSEDNSNSYSGKQNLVAPGTKNDAGLGFSIKGKPEVDTRFTCEIKTQPIFLKGDDTTYNIMVLQSNVNEVNWDSVKNTLYTMEESSGNFIFSKVAGNAEFNSLVSYYKCSIGDATLSKTYYPVSYGMDSTSGKKYNYDSDVVKDTTPYDTDTLAGLADALANQIGNTSTKETDANNVTTITVDTTQGKVVEANTDLASDGSINLEAQVIKWIWTFERDSNAYDVYDTILGDLMDGDNFNTNGGYVVKKSGDQYITLTEHTDYNLTTLFDMTVTAEQVD